MEKKKAAKAAATRVPLPNNLANYVDYLTYPADLGTGQAHRVEFHEKKFREIKNSIQGQDLLAFMTFQKSKVAYQVLVDLAPSNDDFPPVAAAYADWVRQFGEWKWGEESALYKDLCPKNVGKAAYTWPACQLVDASVKGQTDNGDGTFKTTVEVNGEGFLPGAKVAVYTYPEHVAVGSPIQANLDDCSTFRYGRLNFDAPTLSKRKYVVEVINDLGTDDMGKPVYQTIADPVIGVFEVV